jgi:hypothetical protein
MSIKKNMGKRLIISIDSKLSTIKSTKQFESYQQPILDQPEKV